MLDALRIAPVSGVATWKAILRFDVSLERYLKIDIAGAGDGRDAEIMQLAGSGLQL